jgi:hypothetical protein
MSAAAFFMLGVAGFEAVYRVWLHHRLIDQMAKQVAGEHDLGSLDEFSTLLHRSSVLDEKLGYRYRPNLNVEFIPVLENLSPRRFRTNSHGHISDAEYPVAKPAGEWRIAVIGDSFTAGVTNSVRWTDVLERELRADDGWRARTGRSSIRVLNLGRDGTSPIQFGSVFDHEAARFEPDVVVVNLLADGMTRKPYSRGRSEVGGAAAREFAKRHFVDPLPWFNPTPEFLARKPAGQRLGLRPKLHPHFDQLITDEDEVIARNLASLRHIQSSHPRMLILYHPTVQDWTNTLRPELAGVKARFFREAGELPLVDMASELPEIESSPESLARWYQVPHDGHPSDRGMELYGKAAARVIRARIP